MPSSPPPDRADDRTDLSPPDPISSTRETLVPHVPKGVVRSEPRRVSEPRIYPIWLPYALFCVLGMLGVGLICGGTIAYYTLTDPGQTTSQFKPPRKEVQFSRWTVVAIGMTCTAGSLLIANRIAND